MNAHTPGPWTVITTHGTIYIETNNEEMICSLGRHLSGSQQSNAKTMANARAISALPDLLAALVGYMSAIDLMNNAMRDGINVFGAASGLIDWNAMARAAIAKATGGAA